MTAIAPDVLGHQRAVVDFLDTLHMYGQQGVCVSSTVLVFDNTLLFLGI